METYSVELYHARLVEPSSVEDFRDAFLASALKYRMEFLIQTFGNTDKELEEAIRKSVVLCKMAGVNSREHFQERFVYDEQTGKVYKDWAISRKGLNLVMINLPISPQTAKCIWELIG